MITFTRYAKRPIDKIISQTQPASVRGYAYQPKPRGLWLTADDEDSWYQWCRGERFPCGPYRYQVHVRDQGLLWLKTSDDIHEFTAKYNYDVTALFHVEGKPDLNWYGHYIDWPRVARDYKGIVIVPYQWGCRMDVSWYYPWDCSSACIWDASIIARVIFKRGGFKERMKRWSATRARMRKINKEMRSGKMMRKMQRQRNEWEKEQKAADVT
jgi:hypothetical protein